MEKHVNFVGGLSIGLGALGIFMGFLALIAMVGVGLASGYPTARNVMFIIGPSIAFFLTVTSLPGIVGGIGLLRRKAWGRVLVMIYAVLSLLSIPIGTAFGIYAIWTLMQDETLELFAPDSGAGETPTPLKKAA